MRKLNTKKTMLAAAAMVALGGMAAQQAVAGSGSVDATITVITAVGVTAQENMEFGKIVAPTDTQVKWTLSPTPTSYTLTKNGSDSFTMDGIDPAIGEFEITAEPNYQVNVTTTLESNFDPSSGLSLDVRAEHILGGSTFTFPEIFPGFILPVPMRVGGELTIDVGAQNGLNGGGDAAVVRMTANY